jgi:hypothetical protein
VVLALDSPHNPEIHTKNIRIFPFYQSLFFSIRPEKQGNGGSAQDQQQEGYPIWAFPETNPSCMHL